MLHMASMLLRQTEKDGFTATSDFQQMKNQKGDIVLLSSLDLLPGEYVTPLTMGVSATLDLKNIKALPASQQFSMTAIAYWAEALLLSSRQSAK